MSRGWTWIDEDAEHSEEEHDRLTPILNELAASWSSLHSQIEQEGWARQAAYEEGDSGPYFDSDEEMQEYQDSQRKRSELRGLRLEVIEVQLAHFGARMMRPYEHWIEDEQYMAHMERED